MQFIIQILIITLIALAIALFQYIYQVHKKDRNYILFTLRFATIFLILLLIINPKVKKTIINNEKPLLNIAVDNSTSIKFNDLEKDVISAVNYLKSNTDITSKFNLNWLSFGNEVVFSDTLNFNETSTNLSEVLKTLNNLSKNRISANILITDGNQNKGNQIQYNSLKTPLYPIIVGDTSAYEDILIERINSNSNTYLKNQFPVEVFISYQGENTISKKFTVRNNSNVLISKNIVFNTQNNSTILNFKLPATSVGKQFYTVKIENLLNEKNTTNNQKDFAINVVDNLANIAIISNIVHPDVGSLKNAIESSEQRKVTIVNTNNFRTLSKYQLVILYQPTASYKPLFEELNSSKTNYLIITGSATDWNLLNTMQPFFKKQVTNQLELAVPVLNQTYENYHVSNFNFSAFPPLTDYFGALNFNTKVNTLLYKKTNGINTQNPLLATFVNQNQKIGVLLGENSWKWRMQSYIKENSFQNYDEFISNLMQYLTSNKLMDRLSVAVNNFYNTAEELKITAQYTNANLVSESSAKLWISIFDENKNEIRKLPFNYTASSYEVIIPNLPQGIYTYKVSVENEKFLKTGIFKVVPFEIENQLLNSSSKHLLKVAENSKGKLYLAKNTSILVDDLLQNNSFKTIQKKSYKLIPIIDWYFILIAILILLSAEWFYRKYLGKI